MDVLKPSVTTELVSVYANQTFREQDVTRVLLAIFNILFVMVSVMFLSTISCNPNVIGFTQGLFSYNFGLLAHLFHPRLEQACLCVYSWTLSKCGQLYSLETSICCYNSYWKVRLSLFFKVVLRYVRTKARIYIVLSTKFCKLSIRYCFLRTSLCGLMSQDRLNCPNLCLNQCGIVTFMVIW